jgi:hypothetical protein
MRFAKNLSFYGLERLVLAQVAGISPLYAPIRRFLSKTNFNSKMAHSLSLANKINGRHFSIRNTLCQGNP